MADFCVVDNRFFQRRTRNAQNQICSYELCALVDQLFNSLDDLNQVSATDEESFAIALQTLRLYM